MALLQSLTNAQLKLDSLAYLKFVIVLIQASINYFYYNLFYHKIYPYLFYHKKFQTLSYWDSYSGASAKCLVKKTMNASCTDTSECQSVKGLSCLNNKCDCSSGK